MPTNNTNDVNKRDDSKLMNINENKSSANNRTIEL